MMGSSGWGGSLTIRGHHAECARVCFVLAWCLACCIVVLTTGEYIQVIVFIRTHSARPSPEDKVFAVHHGVHVLPLF